MWALCFSASYLGLLKGWLLARRPESPSCYASDCWFSWLCTAEVVPPKSGRVCFAAEGQKKCSFGFSCQDAHLSVRRSGRFHEALDKLITSDSTHQPEFHLRARCLHQWLQKPQHTQNNWALLCCSQLAIFPHPSKQNEEFFTFLIFSFLPKACFGA